MRIRRKIDSCRRMRRSGSVAVHRRAEESRLIENTDAHQSERASKRAEREVDIRISTVPTLLTTDASSNVTTLAYDIRGRKTSMTDPDMGAWSYSYNALGELVSQSDAKGQTTTMAYDVLGRMTSRTEAEGSTTWSYDTATQGKGKLSQVAGPNGYLRT